MTDKLYLITEAQRRLLNNALMGWPKKGDAAKALVVMQSLPMVTGEPENKDVVELYGMKDGIQVHLGQAPTPPRMKAKEIVTDMFGHFDEHDDMDDGNATLCFSCMTELINYMQKLPKPSPQFLTTITADDVTDAMLDALNANTHPASTRAEILAAAVNAYLVIKHRSEA